MNEMIFEADPYLEPFKKDILRRHERFLIKRGEMSGAAGSLSAAVNNHLYYGVHRCGRSWVFREWAPHARSIYVKGDFNGWKVLPEYRMKQVGNGNWELTLPLSVVHHGDLFKWQVCWDGGEGERIPAYAQRCVQDVETKLFSAQVWSPARAYRWKHPRVPKVSHPLIYEVHIGMSGEEPRVSTFKEFAKNVLPRIARLGYNTIQIMALQEHPYYGSFGYQVSSFFALSSRFGTPEEFKALVDKAHGLGIAVVMDIVHSHAVKNELEGLGMLDGSRTLYFHDGPKGDHPAWGTRCFDYGKDETLYFLLSNCKFWMEEYRLDGFRFDGITSMIYWDHGLGRNFGGYADYFSPNTDLDALVYLSLANTLIREIHPDALTIAEDMSGMPGLAAPVAAGGCGFGYRMSMGVPDHWIKWIKELPDERWNVCDMWWKLTDKRADEQTVSYAECHDQAMVGDKTIMFRLADAEMYTGMNNDSGSLVIDRAVALHKMIRLATIATAGNGYLTFMGNEFGHPEWIDFPREGNQWSYAYARRQWSLADNPFLRYGKLQAFDRRMIRLFRDRDLLSYAPVSVYNDELRQVMALRRGSHLFVFNFSPDRSYQDYPVPAQEGRYGMVLDTDWKEFGGFGRNSRRVEHVAEKDAEGCHISLYLPARTAFVLELKLLE